MIRVYQDIFGEQGNCLSAAVASIFELKLRDVPHFSALNIGPDGKPTGAWYRHLWDFAGSLGYDIYYRYKDKSGRIEMMEGALPYHIIGGASPRGYIGGHAVVGYNGKIIHDPHPDQTGLASIDDFGFFIPRGLK